jgi:hypothetical protein
VEIVWTGETVALTVIMGVLVLGLIGAVAFVVWDLLDARRTERAMAERHEGWVRLMTEAWAAEAERGRVGSGGRTG